MAPLAELPKRMTAESSSSASTAVNEDQRGQDEKEGTNRSTDEKAADTSEPIVRRRTTFLEPVSRRSTTMQEARELPGIRERASKEQVFEADQAKAEREVGWDEDDPENPLQWSSRYKWSLVALVCLCTTNATLPSAQPSAALPQQAATLGVSLEVSELIISLFLLGYVAGPILHGPLSEKYGRRYIFVASMLASVVFQLGGALESAGIVAMLVCRFFAGCFASAPLVLSGAVCADLFSPTERGAAFCVFCTSVFYGALIGPSTGGFLANSYLGWRWIYWIQMIFAAVCLVLVLFLPETYAPVLLARRAKRLRREDPQQFGDVYAPLEKLDKSWSATLERTIYRPFKMLFNEPILVAVTLYLSVAYGLLYGLLTSVGLIFQGVYGFNAGESGLVFLGIATGATGAGIVAYLLFRKYKVLVPRWHGSPPPEERLPPAMIGGPIFAVSIFWLAWTCYPSVPWPVCALSLVPMGFAFTSIFVSLLTYLADTYTLYVPQPELADVLSYAASALAANTIIRSGTAATFPLWTRQFYGRLGLHWATSFFGFLAIALAAIPYIFHLYGSRIRGASQFAPCLDLKLKETVEIEQREEKLRSLGDPIV